MGESCLPTTQVRTCTGADDASPTCRGRRRRSFATQFRCRDRRPRSGTTGRTTRRDQHGADDGGNDAAPNELTPQVEIDYAARPAWVDREDRDEGSVHQISVCSGPYLRQREARKELGRQLQKATDEYINEFLANASAARWLGYDEARIRQTLVSSRNIYDEKVISPSFGVMYQSHALLEFGPEFHRDVERAWHQIVARAQLAKLALAAVAVLGTLVLLFSYFHADTATQGLLFRPLEVCHRRGNTRVGRVRPAAGTIHTVALALT